MYSFTPEKLGKAAACAEAMREIAEQAAKAGNEAMFDAIDKADDLDDHHKIGAFMTAACMMFYNALSHAEDFGPEQKKLLVGMFKTTCAEKLGDIMANMSN